MQLLDGSEAHTAWPEQYSPCSWEKVCSSCFKAVRCRVSSVSFEQTIGMPRLYCTVEAVPATSFCPQVLCFDGSVSAKPLSISKGRLGWIGCARMLTQVPAFSASISVSVCVCVCSWLDVLNLFLCLSSSLRHAIASSLNKLLQSMHPGFMSTHLNSQPRHDGTGRVLYLGKPKCLMLDVLPKDAMAPSILLFPALCFAVAADEPLLLRPAGKQRVRKATVTRKPLPVGGLDYKMSSYKS